MDRGQKSGQLDTMVTWGREAYPSSMVMNSSRNVAKTLHHDDRDSLLEMKLNSERFGDRSTIVSPTPRTPGSGDFYIKDCRKSIAKILHQLDDQDDGKSLLEMTLNRPDVFGGETSSPLACIQMISSLLFCKVDQKSSPVIC